MATLDQRRALRIAALGLCTSGGMSRVVGTLARWLDSWRGLGAVVAGMTAQGFNAELKEFPNGWRVNFYPVGIAHSVVAGSAYEPTSWWAVQRASWAALRKAG